MFLNREEQLKLENIRIGEIKKYLSGSDKIACYFPEDQLFGTLLAKAPDFEKQTLCHLGKRYLEAVAKRVEK